MASSSRRTRYTILAAGLALIATALVSCADAEVPAAKGCAPLERPEPNAPDQRPAFAGQTRACADRRTSPSTSSWSRRGSSKPWAVEPLPGGDLLVTEKAGPHAHRLGDRARSGEPIAGLPAVDARGQGGLLDVALSPPSRPTARSTGATPSRARAATRRASRAACSRPTARALEQVRVIFRALPTYDGDKHFGSRLAFGPDGMLYVTLGERSDTPMRPHAQQLDSHLGKVVRITPDGSAPRRTIRSSGTAGALPEIWSLGHRNVQAAAFDAQGQLWDGRARHARRRRAEPRSRRARTTAGRWSGLRRSSTRGSRSPAPLTDARRHGAAGLLLGSGDRALGRAVLHRRRVPGVARQPLRRRAEGDSGSCGSCSRTTG